MHFEFSLHDNDSLLTVTGTVGTVDVPALCGRMLDALETNQGDVLLDMRQVRSVSDHLGSALIAARQRAKHLRRRVVVIDDVTGTTSGSLCRLGLQFQIPVYSDPAAAVAGLRADPEGPARLDVGRGDAPSPAPVPLSPGAGDGRDVGPDDEARLPVVQAGRALWVTTPPRSNGRQ